MGALDRSDVRPLDRDLELPHRLLHELRGDLALPGERGEGRHGDGLLVDLEEAPQRLARVRAAEAVRAQHHEVAADVALHEPGHGHDVVRGGHGDAVPGAEAVLDPAAGRGLRRVQARVAVGLGRLAVELPVVRGAPDLAGHVVLREDVHRVQDLLHDGAGADEPHGVRLPRLGRHELVEALEHALLEAGVFGDRRHGVVLVVQGDVVDHVLLLGPHLLDAVLDDVGHLVGEGRVPADDGGVGERHEERVPVLVLQALAVQRRAARGGAQQEAPGPRVRALPDHVAHALEAEHGVVDEEGQRGSLLGGVGRGRGDPGHDGAALADALLEDLAVGCLRVLHDLVGVHGRVVLAEGRVDLEDREEGVQAEGPGLVGDHQGHARPELPGLHHLAQDLREAHGRADLPALGARVEHVEGLLVGRQLDQGRDLGRLARGQVAAQLGPALGHVLGLRGVRAGVHEVAGVRDLQLLVADGDAERIAESGHVRVGHHLLLVHGVPAQEGLQAVALQRLDEDHRGPAAHLGVLLRLLHGRVDLGFVVAAGRLEGVQQLLVAPVRHAVQEPVLLEDVLPHQGAVRLGVEPLAVAVQRGLQGLDEPAVVVCLDELGELLPPDELDDIEAGAAEGALKLLHDLGVAAHGAVEPLVVAVHDEDHVVQLLAAGDRDGRDGLGLVHLTVAHEGPDAALGGVRQAAQVQVAEEPGLVDRAQGAEAHGDRGVLPKLGHEPRVRVAGDAPAARLAAEVHEVLDVQPALEEGPRVGAGRRMALHPDAVAPAPAVVLAPEEVVHADLEDVGDGRKGADVAPPRPHRDGSHRSP
mmetsp:Transcript_37037/g.117885  ORF Transcript_37037/g.117885 Transcript_37037/m.117885 type:complete len:813 (-) Transcript_37037:807-3245(-)